MPRGEERVTLPFYHRGGVRLLVTLFYKNQNVPRKGWGVGWGGGGSKDREQTLPLCYLEPGEYPENFEEGGGGSKI